MSERQPIRQKANCTSKGRAYSDCRQEYSSRHLSGVMNICQNHEMDRTIMPNVHAVKPIFTIPVNTSRNTFSHMAVGLQSR